MFRFPVNARSIGLRFAWYVALLLATPAIVATSWSDVLAHPVWVLYTLVSACLLVAFAVKAPARRLTTLLLLISLVALHGLGAIGIGWERIVVVAVVVSLVVIATEVVRQNLELVRSLERQDAKLVVKILYGAALWSPMLGLAWLGSLAGDWIQDTSVQWVYDQTPVDAYCRGEKQPVPCEGFLLEPRPDTRELSLRQNIEYHWGEIFRTKQQAMLQRIDSADAADGIADAAFMNRAALQKTLNALSANIAADVVLSIPKDNRVTNAEVLARDVQLQRLMHRRAQLNAEIRRMGGGFPWILMERLRMIQEADRVARQIGTRQTALLAAAKPHLISAQAMQGSVRLQLLRRFGAAAPLTAAGLLAATPTQVSGARAQLAAVVVNRLAELEAATLKTALAVAASVSAMHDASPARTPAAASQFAALGVLPLCSNEIESPDVYLDADSTRRARINTAPFPCRDGQLLAKASPEPIGLAESLELSVSRWRQAAEAAIETSTRNALVGTLHQSKAAAAEATALAHMVPAEIHLGRKRCALLAPGTWGNCASNWAKARAEGTYRSTRADAQREYELLVTDFRQGSERSAAELILYKREQGLRQLAKAEAGLRDAIGAVTTFLDVLFWLLLLFLVVTLIKSFLYVIALVVFDFQGPSLVQVDDASRVTGAPPTVASAGGGINFNDVDTVPLVTKAHLDNQAVSIELAPWPFQCVLSRLLHRKYFAFNVGGPYTPGATPEWQCPTAKNIVDWKLAPGEEVIFSYAHFFGASRNVVLRSRISFRLSTMLLGRFTFHSAYAKDGPGHLLLLTEPVSKRSVQRDDIDAAAPERFIAWHAHTSFKVANALTIRSIFMDPFALVRVAHEDAKGRVLVASSTRSVVPFSGLFRYVTRVISPF